MKDYFELFEKYINGKLKREKIIWFENELKTNPEFAKEFNLHKDVNKALMEKDVIELREQLETIHHTVIEDGKGYKLCIKQRHRISWWYAAASVAILIGLGSLFYILNRPYSNEKLYSMNYKPYEASMNVRSNNTNSNEILRQALQKYEQKDYKNALNIFKQILEKDKTNIAVNFYSGISYIETNNYKEAIKYLQFIINDNNNLFVEQAEWYSGLCFLKADETEKAIEQFEKIAESNSFYKDRALGILKKMR